MEIMCDERTVQKGFYIRVPEVHAEGAPVCTRRQWVWGVPHPQPRKGHRKVFPARKRTRLGCQEIMAAAVVPMHHLPLVREGNTCEGQQHVIWELKTVRHWWWGTEKVGLAWVGGHSWPVPIEPAAQADWSNRE
ncbi:uncharacterized protein CANTADRAFT_230667 [Suhomyces tanzawaensis NRRL Y-17324]|uniref:Uncharacterized protein n=1 Tax=Suhomyces tanzawaensis NRRL Y-17324 TaxID=984487 RepID=A0A1E4SL88_9ASCO|nr:uncharacterized protein CANTADRAFT_230667 [Suhomyces tanzawaensis NRRL Y-17324]ODV80263.1 hypothetical protein CANTADRAFT_230667 [Suhomyces tanzawaensis NRRL Y-17324]